MMKVPGTRATVFLFYLVQHQQCLHTGPVLAKYPATEDIDNCRNQTGLCNSQLQHSVCDLQTGTCQCLGSHPVRLDNKLCLQAVSLDSLCHYNEECQHTDKSTVCLQVTSTSSYCRCAANYEKLVLSDRSQCIESQPSPTKHTVPTLAGLGIGLSVMSCFLCFTLKLFSKARIVETRGFGDASIPPTIMVEGKDISGDGECCSRASSKSRIYTPGPPLTPTQVRRMSTLSTLSVTVQDKGFTVRPVSPAAGSNDPLFEQDDLDVEQQLTVIPRIGSLRRKSLIDHAFPELHQKSNSAGVSNSLLILTRTKTDSQGRRHSVAVPLLATPEGSRTDSGYLVERKMSGPVTEPVGKGRRLSLQVGSTSKSPQRRQGSRRASTRRPSKQGFYQFLDQAVAH